MNKTLISALAAGLALSAASAATAKEVTISVNHAGLDLTDPADLQIMHERIELAAARACVAPTGSFINTREARAECRKEGIAKAKAQLELRSTVARAEAKDSRS